MKHLPTMLERVIRKRRLTVLVTSHSSACRRDVGGDVPAERAGLEDVNPIRVYTYRDLVTDAQVGMWWHHDRAVVP